MKRPRSPLASMDDNNHEDETSVASSSDGVFGDADEFQLMSEDYYPEYQKSTAQKDDPPSKQQRTGYNLTGQDETHDIHMAQEEESDYMASMAENDDGPSREAKWKDAALTFLQPKRLQEINSDLWKIVSDHCQSRLKQVVETTSRPDDVQRYLEWYQNYRRGKSDLSDRKNEIVSRDLAHAGALIDGDPRSYQRALLEKAKRGNVIVHLGTGYGKTLIALLLIQHVHQDVDSASKKTKTVFLVPSVVLALQHTATLRANLPFRVAVACCETSSNTDHYRQQLASAEILVATHGALWDLLLHYQDLISLDRYALMVVDECHYCSGNHAIRLIFQKFYHTLSQEQRPHVLGLTASPIINLRNNHTEGELDQLIQTLEESMDAVLVSENLGDDFDKQAQNVKEEVVSYHGIGMARSLPSAANLLLHPSRYRELRQLEDLYTQVGPLVVSLYCKALLRELSRNEFEEESKTEFEAVLRYLQSLIQWCEQECHVIGNQGRSDKLMALESTLEVHLKCAQAVGLVFCHRRVTAIALHNYFSWRESNKKKLGAAYGWGYSEERRKILQYQVNGNIAGIRPNHDNDQFADAASDPALGFDFGSDHCTNNGQKRTTVGDDQFMDAEDDQEASRPRIDPWMATQFRSAALVRDVSGVFTSLSMDQRNANKEDREQWLHIDHNVRDVLTKLRRHHLNLLFATSVVEEGIDVQACSVVVAFDSILTTKSYIQMKGRARKRNARFFVFQDKSERSRKGAVTLDRARDLETRIQRSIQLKTKNRISSTIDRGDNGSQFEDKYDSCAQRVSEPERSAARKGIFNGLKGSVDLQSAKGLLARYCMSMAFDAEARTSRSGLLSHMPEFREHSLVLPSHLPSSLRIVALPPEFQECSKREIHKILSLMACVRLYNHGLLSERLLPLSESDIRQHVLNAAAPRVARLENPALPLETFFASNVSKPKEIFIRRISHCGQRFLDKATELKGEGHWVAIVTVVEDCSNPSPITISHKEFGLVDITFDNVVNATCDTAQFDMLKQFFTLAVDERWRRSCYDLKHLRSRGRKDYKSSFMPYLVGLVDESGQIDWSLIAEIILESHRSEDERQAKVKCLSREDKLLTPRLWTSTLDSHAKYIAFAPAKQTVTALFPVKKEGIETYRDYFEKIRGAKVSPDTELFDVQRYWTLPSSFSSSIPANDTLRQTPKLLKVPQTLVREARIANAHVGLLSCFLPQSLFVYERGLAVASFLEFCRINLPILGSYLSQLPVENVASAMTTKSCGFGDSYEKLEWIGDAVLKMIQTESLLKSIELREWIHFLHEGDLSRLRQEMGSNRRLAEVCKHFGLDRFIMSETLARGLWLPALLDFGDDAQQSRRPEVGSKVFADIVESLLGLVYVQFGYDAALSVGDELQVTVRWQDVEVSVEGASEPSAEKSQMCDIVQRVTDCNFMGGTSLLDEALCHASAGNLKVQSYERLEWTGDAVLCLAARKWIWDNFPDAGLDKMVVLEDSIISNGTLAFISVQTGLRNFLQHKEPTLPGRIENYICNVRQDGHGLWHTDPPKALADIVESLIGAVYVRGGIEAGLTAVRTLLKPVLDVLLTYGCEMDVMHPKKRLQEMVGETLVVETMSEDAFQADVPILDGDLWRSSSRHGTHAIGYIQFQDQVVFAVADPSSSVARNKACAIIVQVLERNPEVLKGLQDLRHRVAAYTAQPNNIKDIDKEETATI